MPVAAADQLSVRQDQRDQMLVYWALTPVFVVGFLWACVLVHTKRPKRSAYAVALLIYLPFPALRALYLLPGVAWFAFIGLAVPAATVETLRFRAALIRALSLPAPVAVGARAHAEPADLPPLDGEVVWSDDERIEIRTADGIYTFHGFTGVVLMFHHLFGPDTDGAGTAWQGWLTGLLG